MTEEFDAIRPYTDAEVPGVIAQLTGHPEIIAAATSFAAPAWLRLLPPLARWLTQRELRRRLDGIATVDQVQALLSRYFEHMIETTTDGFEFVGAERVAVDHPHVFISNHRDIALDPGFMVFALYRSGHPTARLAIGDNLTSEPHVAAMLRLNKSFIVRRGLKGAKSAYAAMSLTSRYVRHSMAEGESIWIAQRQGRTKDGFDRTDPAIIKMLALAWRKEVGEFARIVPQLSLMPVSISYELDPCDRMKAHELAMRAVFGHYKKPPHEDVRSITTGITGYKGRVKLVFGEPVTQPLADPDHVAAALDRQIVANLEVFPTHCYAARCLAENRLLPVPESAGRALRELAGRIAHRPPAERDYLLRQYANVVNNKRELGLACCDDQNVTI
jgi:1-acyl-sn-glycerol-3-phosphate acyltransferase